MMENSQQKRAMPGTSQPGKKKKSCQKYKDSYSVEYPCLKKSTVSDSMIFCILCKKDLNIAHGGRDDCRRHVLSKKHEECAIASSNTKDVASFFQPQNDALDVINAECLFARFLIEHNIPISAADHAKQLFNSMFPDSKIAKKYSSGHTKTTEIIKFMAKKTISDILSELKDELPFSISTDGSNDVNDTKLYPILVTFFDKSRGKITTMLLNLSESNDNTGQGIFNVLNSALEKKCLHWENCVSFSSDNANTMMGKKKGVASFILKENENIILRGCPCHLLHLAAKKATFAVFDYLEIFIMDIFYFLDKSSKRKSNLNLMQKLYGEKEHKILKYTSTRWLSLLNSINRILEQWEPLKAFFSSEFNEQDGPSNRLQNIKTQFESIGTQLNLLFLQNILPLFTNLNMLLQQDEPYIHKLKRTLERFFMDLLLRFVKPTALSDSATELNSSTVNYRKKSKQKDDSELIIGGRARSFISENGISGEILSQFYASVRKFYVESCSYVQEKLLCEDDLLKHAEIADISIRQKLSFSSVLYIVKRFPFLVKEHELDKLEIEFALYQTDRLDNINSSDRIDNIWFEISKILTLNGEIKYAVLPKIMFAILTVPHSNASSERVFSLLKKNQTNFRPSLSTETLEALLIEKINMTMSNEICSQKKFTEKDLKCAKQATYKSLNNA